MKLQSIDLQNGAALLTSLVIVFVIALLGTTIGQQVVTLRKNSTSHYDQTISLTNADSALTEAVAVIDDLAFNDPVQLETKVVAAFANSDWWTNSDNWNGSVEVKNNGVSIEGTPLYLIEDVGAEPKLNMSGNTFSYHFYRLTAKANGKGSALSFLQSYYAVLE